MSGVLARICADRREAVALARRQRPEAALLAAIAEAPPPRGFLAALKARVAAGGEALIAEIKRASPSKGLIRPDFDPRAIAAAYAAAGAACLSVLTEPRYFRGDPAYLQAARAAAGLPVLQKDFILDPWQVLEARAIGADCILLIVAALDDGALRDLAAAASGLGMDVLTEVHDEAELDRALALGAPLIGINNRNLATLAVDLATTERLAPRVPAGRHLVAESGLAVRADLDRMVRAGVRSFLVGESLMRAPDIGGAVVRLLTGDATARP